MKISRDSFEFLILNFEFNPKLETQNSKFIFIFLALFFILVSTNRAAEAPVGHASDFTSVEYYEAPHQQQIKSRLSGAEASPQAGGLLVIKKLKLEMFDVNGKLEFIVEAPECIYDTLNGAASSAGHLQLQTGDGKIRVEGEGFLWRENDSSLTISNQVRTVIESAPETKIGS